MPGFSKTEDSTMVVRVVTDRPGSLIRSSTPFQTLDRGRRHLQHVAVVARHVMAFQHARVGRELLDAELVVARVRVADGDEGGDRKAHLGPVQPGVVPLDIAGLLQPLDPLHDGGAGETNFVGDGLIAGAAVLGQQPEDVPGGGIDGRCGQRVLAVNRRSNIGFTHVSSTSRLAFKLNGGVCTWRTAERLV